ncbi:MAG: hypothetical protein Q9226_008686, partial [Calogaya cf. arnoldii]
IQQKLSESHFNDAYLLFARLKELLQPVGEAQFIRLQRKLYTLDTRSFESSSELLDKIKSLEDQIDSTKIHLTADKRSLLALIIALSSHERYRSLIQIWQTLPDITAERARQILLEEDKATQA